MYGIGIDLGGSFLKGVLVSETGEALAHRRASVDETGAGGPEAHWKHRVRTLAEELANAAPAHEAAPPVGLAAPGLANETNTAIACMPGRLAGLEGFAWSAHMGRPVSVLNDAHAALLCESRFGAGRGQNSLVMLTLGTGVGGGVLINGQVYQGVLSRAGHLGHIAAGHTPEQDITGLPGSLEDAIGNATLPARSHGRYTDTDALVADYRRGDPFAAYVWLTSVRHLAVGLSSIINAFAPEAVVLGGGMTGAGEDLFGPLRSFMNLYEWRPQGFETPILEAVHGGYAGAMGAAAFALSGGGAPKPPPA